MRFERIFVDRFGPLAGVDTGPDPLGRLVVVTGPNEAGKTSFFMALRALMHGLYPASRDGNPWAPWDGSDLEVRADVTPARGTPFRVHRRLLSSPWGRIRLGDREEDLRNDAIPPARRVGRKVHEQVYTIGLPDLLRLQEGPGWTQVRDELVLGMGTRDLVPPREVAEALGARADSLWRPDRRSRSTRDRQLAAAVEEASERLGAARERDRRLRGLHRELGEVRLELTALRDSDVRHRQVVEEARRLEGPVRRLQLLRHYRAQAGDPTELEGLPTDPVDRVEAALAQHAAAEAGLAEAREELRRRTDDGTSLSPAASRLLQREELVASVLGRRELAGELAARQEDALRALRRDRERLATDASELLDDGAAQALASGRAQVLDALPSDAAATALDELEDTRTRRIRAEEAFRESEADAEADVPSPPGPLVGSLLLLAGLPVLLATLLALGGSSDEFGPATLALAVGAVAGLLACGYGLHQVVRWRNRKEQLRQEWDEKARRRQVRLERLSDARTAEEEARRALDELLAPLPLLDARRRAADRDLLRDLRELRERAIDLASREAALEEGTRAQRELAADVDELRTALLHGEDPGSALPASLSGALEALADRRSRALAEAEATRAGRRAMEEARRTLGTAEAGLDRARRDMEELERILPAAPDPDGDPPSHEEMLRIRARRARLRLDALRDARRIETELVEEAGGPEQVARDLEALLANPLHQDPGPEELQERIRRDGIRREELVAREAELRTSIGELEESETPDRVEAEIRRLEEERREIREQRDLAFVLSRIVRTAEREFRETHQPELVQRAGRFLGQITGGRYDRLLLGDEADPDALHLAASHLPGILPAREPFSTGIREQVYLSLRLAVLEMVDGGGEPLPLVLDEVLVNWDPDRRSRALDLLAELSEERQVFIMTCHPAMAREARSRGARLVELEAAP